MKRAILVTVIVFCMGFIQMAVAQTMEMAAKCEVAEKQLAEWIKKPDSTDAQKIKDALGLDILNSCPTKGGQVVCYQCIDKDQNLRALQLILRPGSNQFEWFGYGCLCQDTK